MYKIIYKKDNRKVVSIIPFNYVEEEISEIDENGEEVKSTIIKCDTQFFYNTETCDTAEVENLPTITPSKQYFTWEGKLVVNKNIDDRTYSQKVEELIRYKYSVSDEIAILRQRDIKASEFEEYNAFCEQCKATAKGE